MYIIKSFKSSSRVLHSIKSIQNIIKKINDKIKRHIFKINDKCEKILY